MTKSCNICGNPDRCQWVIQYEEDKWLECCDRCNYAYLSCPTCANLSMTCRFDTDSSPLTKGIQVVEQNGPVKTIITTMNPERMKITCPGCPCYHDEKCGAKPYHGRHQNCENYQVKLTPINYST